MIVWYGLSTLCIDWHPEKWCWFMTILQTVSDGNEWKEKPMTDMSSAISDPVRILVVDDDPDILFGTCRTLVKSGYEVIKAGTGEEALKMALQHRPDLILLDSMLPDEEGIEVCAKIKAILALANTIVVMISGVRINLEYQLQAFFKGADGYIARPIGNQELVAQVGAFVRIKGRGSSLRKRAETIVQSYPKLNDDMSADAVHHLIHEFQVYQAELEIQNDEVLRTQVELEESRDRYAALYHRAPIGYASLDEAAIIREANQTFSNMVGVPLHQLIGSAFSRWISENDRSLFHSFFPAFYRYPVGKSLEVHLWHESEDKTVIALQGSRPEIPDSHSVAGARSGLIHVAAVDVTVQRQAEKKLQESEARFRMLFDDAVDGIALFDAVTGCLQECNKAFAEMMDTEKIYLLTGHSFLLKPDADEKPALCLSLTGLQDMSNAIREITAVTISGEIRQFSLKAKSTTLDGRPVIQAIFRDVTPVKQGVNT
jgi:PAS domain S-box-containing protein